MCKNNRITLLLTYLGIDTNVIPQALLALSINNLQTDSRQIRDQDIFIALAGHRVDGHDYINSAIANGASVILSDTDNIKEDKAIVYCVSKQDIPVPIVSIYQLHRQLSALATFFYCDPSSVLTVIGVTGTNGKTTITQLLAQLITLCGKKAAVMGTIGNGIYNQLTPSDNTTMAAIDVQSQLACFIRQGAEFVAMEVSSHGLAEGRVMDVSFDVAIFTNLSHDHLDFHGSMAQYALAKRRLFDENQLAVKTRGIAIINYDDIIGQQWLNELENTIAVSIDCHKIAALTQHKHYIGVKEIDYYANGTTMAIISSWGCITLKSPLIGEFNVFNLLAAIAALLALGYSLTTLASIINKIHSVPGRMELFTVPRQPVMIVDYAHSPDALIKALQASRKHCSGQLWLIFGCGGDRDRDKRPIMANIAERFADRIMLTYDNPRTEDPSQITNDILQGFSKNITLLMEPRRDKAIKKVFMLASPNDTILIAGKGHEDYQIIGTVKHNYSDRRVVSDLLGLAL